MYPFAHRSNFIVDVYRQFIIKNLFSPNCSISIVFLNKYTITYIIVSRYVKKFYPLTLSLSLLCHHFFFVHPSLSSLINFAFINVQYSLSSSYITIITLSLFLLISLVFHLNSWFCFLIELNSSTPFFLTLSYPTIINMSRVSLCLQMDQFLLILSNFSFLIFSLSFNLAFHIFSSSSPFTVKCYATIKPS